MSKASFKSDAHNNLLPVHGGLSASLCSLIFHVSPSINLCTADPSAGGIQPEEQAPTSFSVRHSDVNGWYGGIGMVAVVLDEKGVFFPGLLYHRNWSTGKEADF